MKIDNSLIKKLKRSSSIVFFTGAGISAESGIATFRGENGIWNKLKPEELANFDAFMRNPDMVWEWYNHRKKIIHNSNPDSKFVRNFLNDHEPEDFDFKMKEKGKVAYDLIINNILQMGSQKTKNVV